MRVVIADGHPVMRLGLKALLLATEMRVVGEAETGEEALRLAERWRPNLVILGLNLTGDVDCIEACARLKAVSDPPRVLVHTAYNVADDVASCLLAGADGFLHKSTRCERLLDALRRVAAGKKVWAPGERVGEPRSRLSIAPGGAALTAKEREVLAQMVRGRSNAEIAQGLYLCLPTVKTHVRSILRKFGAVSREGLLRRMGSEDCDLEP